eukprot:TRINITY_DN10235_c0_g1_i4.p1 TRINITY_DN10235_c0_g1~~TRINITY_DN10235_c0_g1_i4.p1  ORF type:complete len:463 (-),score=59.93 TRINITY_DN10235_c0_g1_i4:404-1792(-)
MAASTIEEVYVMPSKSVDPLAAAVPFPYKAAIRNATIISILEDEENTVKNVNTRESYICVDAVDTQSLRVISEYSVLCQCIEEELVQDQSDKLQKFTQFAVSNNLPEAIIHTAKVLKNKDIDQLKTLLQKHQERSRDESSHSKPLDAATTENYPKDPTSRLRNIKPKELQEYKVPSQSKDVYQQQKQAARQEPLTQVTRQQSAQSDVFVDAISLEGESPSFDDQPRREESHNKKLFIENPTKQKIQERLEHGEIIIAKTPLPMSDDTPMQVPERQISRSIDQDLQKSTRSKSKEVFKAKDDELDEADDEEDTFDECIEANIPESSEKRVLQGVEALKKELKDKEKNEETSTNEQLPQIGPQQSLTSQQTVDTSSVYSSSLYQSQQYQQQQDNQTSPLSGKEIVQADAETEVEIGARESLPKEEDTKQYEQQKRNVQQKRKKQSFDFCNIQSMLSCCACKSSD